MNTSLKLFRFLGPTLLFFGTFVVFPPLVMSHFGSGLDANLLMIWLATFIYAIIIALTLRRRKFSYTPKDVFIITFVTWVFVSLIASFPFIWLCLSFSDSVFEAGSGLTTRGSSSITNL